MSLDSPKRKSLIYSIFIVYLLFSGVVSKAHADDVRIPAPRGNFDPVHDYIVDLTRLILSKNKQLYPESKLVFVDFKEVTQGRIFVLLEHNYVDIIWSGTDSERELNYLPIRIPLFRGFLGYRALLIRQEDKDKFLQIDTPSKLKQYTACQGAHWPDSDILETNGYPVLRVANFHAMYKMLAIKRCDYFPRAIFEAYAEQKAAMKTFSNIMVMDELILHYKFPFYFFVKKNNVKLAQRLETGLMIALADGSLMNLMKNHKITKHIFPLTQWQDKRYFELSNTVLGIKLPLNNKQFWLNLKAH